MKKVYEFQSLRSIEINNDFKAEAASSTRKNLSKVGYWAALLTVVVAAAHFVAGVATPVRIIPYPYVDGIASFVPTDYLWLYPGFLLAPIFVLLMACIYHYAAEDKKIFGQIALSFALVYAAVIATDYFIQLTMVQPSLLNGETAGLSLFVQYNPHGVFIALEGLGYLMMSTALIFAAAVFSGGRLERAIRLLFASSFVLAVGSLVGLSLLYGKDLGSTFEVTVLTINWIVLIVAGALLSIIFKRAARLAGRKNEDIQTAGSKSC